MTGDVFAAVPEQELRVAGRRRKFGRGEVVIPLSQEHLAGLAGTTRETVNRVLKKEEEEEERGLVRLGRNRIVVAPGRVTA